MPFFSKPFLAWSAAGLGVLALASAGIWAHRHSAAPAAPFAHAPSSQAQGETLIASTPDCPAVKKRAQEIMAVLDRKASAAIQARMRNALANPNPQFSLAKMWDDFAALAYLQAHPDTSLWAELHALQLSWEADYVGHAGVYLVALKNLDDAKLFLHCSYDMGWRSPSLFEALALAYYRSGDNQRGGDWIDQAAKLAPDDAIIRAEKSIITTGNPPAPPKPGGDDLDAALDGLEKHLQRVSGQIRAEIAIHKLLQAIFQETDDDSLATSQPDWEAGMKAEIDKIRKLLPLARISYEDLQKQFPGTSIAFHQAYKQSFRNDLLSECAFQYAAITDRILLVVTSFDIPFGPYKLDLWSHALHEDLMSYARQLKAAQDVLDGHSAESAIDGPAEAAFYTASVQAGKLRDGVQDQHAADVAWCAAIIPAFQTYKSTSRSLHQRAADGYNEAAKEFLHWGATEVLDVRAYYKRTMAGVSIMKMLPSAPRNEQILIDGHNQTSELGIKQAKEEYETIRKLAVGSSPDAGIPSMLATQKQMFAGSEQNAESQIESMAQTISRTCSPIAAEVLKKLNGDESEKTREELFEELEVSLGIKAEFAPNCNFSFGPLNASINLDVETGSLNSQVGGSWDIIGGDEKKAGGKGAEGGAAHESGGGDGGGETSLTGSANVTFDDHGQPTGIEGGAGIDVDAEGVVGSGEVTLAREKENNGEWKTTAQIKATVGVGFKEGSVGAACYPGEVSMQFEPRVVLDNAVKYLQSSNAAQK